MKIRKTGNISEFNKMATRFMTISHNRKIQEKLKTSQKIRKILKIENFLLLTKREKNKKNPGNSKKNIRETCKIDNFQ